MFIPLQDGRNRSAVLHAFFEFFQAVPLHHCNCYIVQQPLTNGLSTRPTPVAIKHSKEHALWLEKTEKHKIWFYKKQVKKNTDFTIARGKKLHASKQVAALRRSSLGVLAASWLLSNFLTTLSPLPSNSGTLTDWNRDMVCVTLAIYQNSYIINMNLKWRHLTRVRQYSHSNWKRFLKENGKVNYCTLFNPTEASIQVADNKMQ